MSFEANQGQTDPQVKFLSRGAGYSLFLTAREAVLALGKPSPSKPSTDSSSSASLQNTGSRATTADLAVLRIKLIGANATPKVEGLDELPGKSNYFTEADPAKWRTNVPSYGRVRYEAVYPGVDLIYDGSRRQLEYDWIVSPGADPSAIKLGFDGARGMRLATNGDLVLELAGGEVRQHKPLVYQEGSGTKQQIAGRYRLLGKRQVGFAVGEYDRSKPLVIDPVLSYSTFLGGGDGDERGNAIAVDSSGNAYVAGETRSARFPTTPGAYQRTGTSRFLQSFVSKLDSTGTTLLYSTYLGPDFSQIAGIAIDVSGNAYVTGVTTGSFPTTAGAYQTTYRGNGDAFVTKLNSTGSALLYSTYLGGTNAEIATGIALDSSGTAYVLGDTESSNFPTTAGAYQTAYGGDREAFVTALDSSGATLLYSTYVGGNALVLSQGIAIDSAGDAYITGITGANFPTTVGAYQTTFRGGEEAFVTVLNSSGTGLIYSTYLGGTGNDEGQGIAVDGDGNAYVTGVTRSTNFPTTAGVVQPLNAGVLDAFVTKLSPAGDGLVYSTYLGGTSNDSGQAIAVDSLGNAYVTGSTASTNFPTERALQPSCSCPRSNVFVTKLNSDASGLIYSTYLGGGGSQEGGAIAADGAGNAYLTGSTDSPDFPTANPLDLGHGGYIFVTKIDDTLQSYSIGGRLTDSGGAGLGGAIVRLGGSGNAVTRTDSNGNYSYPYLAAGRNYTMTPTKLGYGFSPSSQTFNDLSANQTADFVGTSYRISGRIATAAGAGVASVLVRLSGSEAQESSTDASGNFAFSNVAAGGNYTVTPTPRLYVYSFSPASQAFSNLSADQTADFTATVLYPIEGRVLDERMSPMNGVTVDLTGSQTGTTTTSGGRFSFLNLPAGGDYTVMPMAPGYSFVPNSVTYPNLSGPQFNTFIGILTDSIGGRVTYGGTGFAAFMTLTGSQTGTTQSNAAGDYVLPVASEGSYTTAVQISRRSPGRSHLTH